MEKEEAKTTVRYILNKENEKTYNKMRDAIKRPVFIQKYLYHQHEIPRQYHARVIVDKEDRISIIDKSFALQIGTNGLFIKQMNGKSGITYKKTGRSSQRLVQWGSGKNHDNFGSFRLLEAIAEEVNPDCGELLGSPVIKEIGTKGMHASIISGAITDKKEAMEYYIRYSMRGVGIKQENALCLYNYLDTANSTFESSMALRVAKDPNNLLKEFWTFNDNLDLRKLIDRNGRQLTQLALAASEKIDWVDPCIDTEALFKRFTTKVTRIKDILNVWEGGPVLRDKVSVTQSNLLSLDDMPF